MGKHSIADRGIDGIHSIDNVDARTFVLEKKNCPRCNSEEIKKHTKLKLICRACGYRFYRYETR